MVCMRTDYKYVNLYLQDQRLRGDSIEIVHQYTNRYFVLNMVKEGGLASHPIHRLYQPLHVFNQRKPPETRGNHAKLL